MHDVEAMPRTLSAQRCAHWVESMSDRPADTLYDEQGQAVQASALDELVANANVAAIPATQSTRYGMVVRRSDLRTFPTRLRVFSDAGDVPTSIASRKSALFPGTPVVVVHESRDGEWWFVVSQLLRGVDSRA